MGKNLGMGTAVPVMVLSGGVTVSFETVCTNRATEEVASDVTVGLQHQELQVRVVVFQCPFRPTD